jgi:hypothetical protein
MKTNLLLFSLLCLCYVPRAQQDTTCLYLLSDSVYWESGQLKYIFTVANPASANFDVGNIRLHSIADSIVDNIDIPEGIPPGGIYTDTICRDVIYTDSTEWCYLLVAHDTPDHFFCCTNLDTICVDIPPFDPCIGVSAQLVNNTIYDEGEESCCFELSLTNDNAAGIINWVDVQLLNPDAQFDDIQNLPGGTIPQGITTYNFCLTESSPLVVHWGYEEPPDEPVILCSDTLEAQCIDCFEIFGDSLACGVDTGSYVYTFSFINASPYVVNAIEWVDTSGNEIWRSGTLSIGVDVLPGDTATNINITLDSIPFSSDSLCLLMVLRQQLPNGVNIRCCNKEICWIRPDCGSPCCRSEEETQEDVDMGFGFDIDCNSYFLTCTPLGASECDFVNWTVNFPNTTTTIGGTTAQGAPFIVGLTENGVYTICMELLRYDEEGNLCFPDQQFEYCEEVDVFCEMLGCIDPDLVNPAINCGQFANPICGCDEMDYINPCAAESLHGITSYTLGACTPWFSDIFLFATGQAGGTIALNWDAPLYYEFDYFAIQRQQWFNTWVTIGYVTAIPNTTFYNFIDTQPNPGLNTYRVIGATIEGKAIYSPPASAIPGLSPEAESMALVWPNPAQESIHIRFNKEEERYLKLFTTTGQLVAQQDIKAETWQLTLSIAHLSPGFYFLEIEGQDGSSVQQKIVLE